MFGLLLCYFNSASSFLSFSTKSVLYFIYPLNWKSVVLVTKRYVGSGIAHGVSCVSILNFFPSLVSFLLGLQLQPAAILLRFFHFQALQISLFSSFHLLLLQLVQLFLYFGIFTTATRTTIATKTSFYPTTWDWLYGSFFIMFY